MQKGVMQISPQIHDLSLDLYSFSPVKNKDLIRLSLNQPRFEEKKTPQQLTIKKKMTVKFVFYYSGRFWQLSSPDLWTSCIYHLGFQQEFNTREKPQHLSKNN